ncbi:MAG: hypothetical protein ACI88A_003091 [Paraglaciecola sp.]|jgi:hypothetical protein
MYKQKLQSEKLDIVKRLIRQNNYRNHDTTYDQCTNIGLSVSRTSLARFAEKLELLDRLEKSKRLKEDPSLGDMTYEQVKQRETAITFELGELKIRENRLLEELNSLSLRLTSKH